MTVNIVVGAAKRGLGAEKGEFKINRGELPNPEVEVSSTFGNYFIFDFDINGSKKFEKIGTDCVEPYLTPKLFSPWIFIGDKRKVFR